MFISEEFESADFALEAMFNKVPCEYNSYIEVDTGEVQYIYFDVEDASLVYDEILGLPNIMIDPKVKVHANPRLERNCLPGEYYIAGLANLCASFSIKNKRYINNVLCELPFIKKTPPSLISRPVSDKLDFIWCLNNFHSIKTDKYFINALIDRFKRNFTIENDKYSFIPMEDLEHKIDLPICLCDFNGREINPIYVPDMFSSDLGPRIRYYSILELLHAVDTDYDIDY